MWRLPGLTSSAQGARVEDIAASQAALDGARASLQKAQEGGTQQQIIAATADLANADAALRLAQAAYDRVASEADIASRPESLQLEQATNALNAARARLDDVKRGGTAADIAAGSSPGPPSPGPTRRRQGARSRCRPGGSAG